MKIDTLSPAIIAGIFATIFTRSDGMILLVVVLTFSLVTLGYIFFVASMKAPKSIHSNGSQPLSVYLTSKEARSGTAKTATITQVSLRAFND
jgi:Zn-dependent membrane protease YugP